MILGRQLSRACEPASGSPDLGVGIDHVAQVGPVGLFEELGPHLGDADRIGLLHHQGPAKLIPRSCSDKWEPVIGPKHDLTY